MKRVTVAFAVLVGAIGIAACGEKGSGSSSTRASSGASPTAASATRPAEHKSDRGKLGSQKTKKIRQPKSNPTAPAEPSGSASQENALASAESYIELTAFSESGLEGQLKSEGFSAADSSYGASHVGADWNEQAVKSAKSYLELTSFSESGLVQQLESEGFTSSQAQYGVSKAYK